MTARQEHREQLAIFTTVKKQEHENFRRSGKLAVRDWGMKRKVWFVSGAPNTDKR